MPLRTLAKTVKASLPGFLPTLLVCLFTLPLSVPGFATASEALQVKTLSTTPPSPEQVRALLESPLDKDQAWGAWWAAQGKMRELEPQLRENLERSLAKGGHDHEMVLDATLDAFIQFGTDSLPFELLQSVYTQGWSHHAQAIILLSEPPRPQPFVERFMLTLVDQKGGDWTRMEWLTAATLLLNRSAPGLAAAVLRGLKFTEHVVICDAAQPCGPEPPSTVLGSWMSTPPDSSFPPWAHYELAPPGLDSTVFIQGPTKLTTMAYRRYLGESSAPGSPLPPGAGECMAYVVAAAPMVKIPNLDGENLTVAWRDSASYEADLNKFKRKIMRQYSSMIQQLQGARVLTVGDAAALTTPRIEFVVDDRRSTKTPLPEL